MSIVAYIPSAAGLLEKSSQLTSADLRNAAQSDLYSKSSQMVRNFTNVLNPLNAGREESSFLIQIIIICHAAQMKAKRLDLGKMSASEIFQLVKYVFNY